MDIKTIKTELEKLINDKSYIANFCSDGVVNVSDIQELINNLPDDDWISVDTALPDEKGDYYVWHSGGAGILQFDNGNWYFWAGSDEYFIDEHQGEITHWKPINPPRDKQ